MVLCPSCGTVPEFLPDRVGDWTSCQCELLRRKSGGFQWRYGGRARYLAYSVAHDSLLLRHGLDGVLVPDLPEAVRELACAAVLES